MFGRKKKEAAVTELSAQETAEAETPEEPARKVAGPTTGPYDVADRQRTDDYVDLGSLLVKPFEGVNLRLELEESSNRVIAVGLQDEQSSVQLQAFSAPKSEGLWEGISAQIEESVTSQGGIVDRVEGRFGEEVLARVPATGADGSKGHMVARFIGIDGPRWFLRGVIGGEAALNKQLAKKIEDCIAEIIVVRGDSPMPPTELLPLRMPEEVAQQQAPSSPSPMGAPERGPEITEIR
ncbi:DUF3710 domain-containing protein [Neomicrococcus aestuarii]|uniref:DUF3710 domain-containing protein n=1 Tax=Neomicrococcus aestuarii TaxID=556325 RepID=A0A1L2ZKQ3_9MICC|nr:DUF3710 domain-containing protein [Neomicrococcus aestuarii]APF39777.1 hypothetical protein BHE16_00665 [Neomicrococcus aestuarii]